MNAMEEEEPAFAFDILKTSGPDQSSQSQKIIKDKFNLQWLRVSMSCHHKHSRNLSNGFVQETCSQSDLPRLWTRGLQQQNFQKCCLWLQQHVQESNNSPQSQMQQHRNSMHGKHTTTVQSWNATALLWSPKACQTWRKIGFMHQTLCNQIPWCKSVPSQPTWKKNLPHHPTRQPNQCGQTFRNLKLRHMCQRENCNS